MQLLTSESRATPTSTKVPAGTLCIAPEKSQITLPPPGRISLPLGPRSAQTHCPGAGLAAPAPTAAHWKGVVVSPPDGAPVVRGLHNKAERLARTTGSAQQRCGSLRPAAGLHRRARASDACEAPLVNSGDELTTAAPPSQKTTARHDQAVQSRPLVRPLGRDPTQHLLTSIS